MPPNLSIISDYQAWIYLLFILAMQYYLIIRFAGFKIRQHLKLLRLLIHTDRLPEWPSRILPLLIFKILPSFISNKVASFTYLLIFKLPCSLFLLLMVLLRRNPIPNLSHHSMGLHNQRKREPPTDFSDTVRIHW